MSRSATSSIWAVVPAAGIGKRMPGDAPKQYRPLFGRTVIEWALAPLLAYPGVRRVVVALAANDTSWTHLACANDGRVQTTTGGRQRAESVLNALNVLVSDAKEDDWVLVHDAARPCLREEDLARLIDELSGDRVGGLLAVPVADTLKSADTEQRVDATVAREKLWRALTPQMFRFDLLRRALIAAAEQDAAVTDEASAVEILGLKPKLVLGRGDNIKITVSEDLAYADYLLRARMQAR